MGSTILQLKKPFNYLSFILSFFSLSPLIGQTNENAAWSLLKQQKDVSIYYATCKEDNCDKIILKVKNNSAEAVRVSWDSQFTTPYHPVDVKKPFHIKLEAHAVKTGSALENSLSFNARDYFSTFDKQDSEYKIINLKITKL